MLLFETARTYILHLMHTIKQIIENQDQFKQEIITFLKKDLQGSLDVLRNINTDDDEVNAQLNGLKKKIKKMRSPSIASLFFSSDKRNEKYYAWWEAETEEAIIHKYAKID